MEQQKMKQTKKFILEIVPGRKDKTVNAEDKTNPDTTGPGDRIFGHNMNKTESQKATEEKYRN